MDLLNFLFIEFIQHLIIIDPVSESGILRAADIHGIVKDQEASFQFQRTNPGQIEQRFFDIAKVGICFSIEEGCFMFIEFLQ